MNKTKIEWCDSTWNPVTGCRHGCEYCYARKVAERFGKRLPDFRSGRNCGIHCLERKVRDNPYPYIFDPTFLPFRLKEPLQQKKPQTIFVCSMADLFGKWVPDEWIEKVFATCERAPQHRYLFLTKNPYRYMKLFNEGKLPSRDNMWYGTTITKNNDPVFYSDERNTFVSIEPILKPFDLGTLSDGVDWVIVGAETGNRANKVTPEQSWIDPIIKACDKSGRPLFMKDSLLPIFGEENMRREFPWKREEATNEY